ncbi:metal-dependent transcriptional regulator [Pricia sp. S334]|uniref:Transcriptional regulator MntR n=1 Tax=Pricia mediterranea TaxID=3076079 RepID=A0ABU3L5W5_9FLAO|nr:metal-dependent transcriptional regulator [Pricia sp. S334]MDT7829139.1 metal-dependent transcriptional regulator [Pricia sp. S334]
MTSAEEDYIRTIYDLGRGSHRLVPTNAIAERMATTPASVTDMVKKLAQKNIVEHRMYRGVRLTEAGRSAALSILRKERLWEVFLVQKLELAMDTVPEIARQLKHVQNTTLIDKLEAHLDFPTVAPSGEPIPSREGEFKKSIKRLLSDLPVGASGICTATKDASTAFLNFLEKNRIAIGSPIRILDKEQFDGSLGIQVGNREMRISERIAANLFIEVEEG